MGIEGFFTIPATSLSWAVDVPELAAAIQSLGVAGLSPAFLLVFDEPWVMAHQVRLVMRMQRTSKWKRAGVHVILCSSRICSLRLRATGSSWIGASFRSEPRPRLPQQRPQHLSPLVAGLRIGIVARMKAKRALIRTGCRSNSAYCLRACHQPAAQPCAGPIAVHSSAISSGCACLFVSTHMRIRYLISIQVLHYMGCTHRRNVDEQLPLRRTSARSAAVPCRAVPCRAVPCHAVQRSAVHDGAS
jgi:hypothetical protein